MSTTRSAEDRTDRTDGTREGHGRFGRILSGVAVALGCVLFLGGFAWGALLYQPYAVPTGSMEPTINAGDRVLAQRIDGAEVRRGDVVVFNEAEWGDLPMVKRVVAVGGDEVACCTSGRLTVNGKPVDESYLPADTPASVAGIPAPPSRKGACSCWATSARVRSTPPPTSRRSAGAPCPGTPSWRGSTPSPGRWTGCWPAPTGSPGCLAGSPSPVR